MKMSLGKNHTPLRVAFASPLPGTIRGQVLCIVALIIGSKGLGYVFNASSASTDIAMGFLTQFVSLQIVGGIMVAICGFAWFTSYCHHGRDQYGFDALTMMAAALAAIYLVSTFEMVEWTRDALVPVGVAGLAAAVALGAAWAVAHRTSGRNRNLYGFACVITFAATGIYLAHALDGRVFGIQGFLTWLAIAVLTVFLRRLRDVRDEPPRSAP